MYMCAVGMKHRLRVVDLAKLAVFGNQHKCAGEMTLEL